MKCVTPMFRKYIPYTSEEKTWMKANDIKQSQVIVPRSEVFKRLTENPNHLRTLDDLNEIYEKNGNPWRYQTIPCKHCWACNLNYSAEWATRIMCECKESENNFFITLTYDDEHLPIPEYMTLGNEKLYNDGTWTTGTLHPEHVTKFIGSLRKYFERKGHTGIKYFYCGEYGETTQRPHYHMILMNCPLDVNKFHDFHMDERYKFHWKSKEIESYWEHGMIDVAECEWSCAAYVARYCTKKLNIEPKSDRWYFENGKEKEFVRMSRRPGIGIKYFNEHHKDIYKNDEMIMKTVKGKTGSFKPPKAFDKKFEELYPEEYEKLKLSRQEASKRSQEILRNLSDYTDKKMLEISTRKILEKTNWLPRVGEW